MTTLFSTLLSVMFLFLLTAKVEASILLYCTKSEDENIRILNSMKPFTFAQRASQWPMEEIKTDYFMIKINPDIKRISMAEDLKGTRVKEELDYPKDFDEAALAYNKLHPSKLFSIDDYWTERFYTNELEYNYFQREGGTHSDGTHWIVTTEIAIDRIDGSFVRFYTSWTLDKDGNENNYRDMFQAGLCKKYTPRSVKF